MATRFFGGDNLSAIGVITAVGLMLSGFLFNSGQTRLANVDVTGETAIQGMQFGGYGVAARVHATSTGSEWGLCQTAGGTSSTPDGINCYGPFEDGMFAMYNVSSTDDQPYPLLFAAPSWMSGQYIHDGYGLAAATGVHVVGGVFPTTNRAGDLGTPDFSFDDVNASGTARIGTDVIVNGSSVCRANGTNCPAGTGTPTLQQVIAQGSSATSTPTFLGGLVAASSTVTSTLNMPSQFATALLFTDSSRAVSSTSRITVNGNTGSVTSTNLFASVVSSTNLFSNSGGIGILAAGNLTANQGTSTILSWISASGSTLTISGQSVCLANGVNCPVASLTVAGLIEIATVAETSAGTDATRAVSPDGLAGSVFGSKTVEMYLTTSTGAFLAVNGASNTSTCFVVQAPLNGMNLTAVHAQHGVAGSAGTSTQIQVRNETDGVDMLTVPIHIDPGERGSDTGATTAVINTATDDVATFDRICADVDAVETTPGKETIVSLTFSLP